MVVPKDEENLVHDIKLSSVVPGRTTGENKSHDLKPIDLAMKLHYLKGLYFFPNKNDQKIPLITIDEFKPPTFEWLLSYFITCGRIRRMLSPEDPTRPYIKLNDAGIRIVEARSDKTLHDWLAMDDFLSLQDHLVYGRALGPDLGFSPLVFIQVTWFKCGGISVGLSWAHVLGDIFSASTFMNKLGQYLQGLKAQTLALPYQPKPKYSVPSPTHEPISVKRVDPVGDHWVAPTNGKMGTHHFSLSSTQVAQLLSKVYGPRGYEERKGKYFEVVCAIMWKTLAKIRKELEPKVVTICKPDTLNREQVIPHNGQIISTVKVDFSVSDAHLLELVSLVDKKKVHENDMIEELLENDMGKFDHLLYGANLTFVDIEDVNVYGFEVEGQSPIFASYAIGGVGEEGAILVIPGPKDGKLVLVTLPEYELQGLKTELNQEWCIA